MKLSKVDYIIIIIILTLFVITITGINSFDTTNSYEIINQYRDTVKIWGSGIYSHDSYFKAPIFIATDYVVLFILIPLMIIALIVEIRKRIVKTKLFLASIIATTLYYSTSIVFGATYNKLHLIYILLFGCTFFTLILIISEIDRKELKAKQL